MLWHKSQGAGGLTGGAVEYVGGAQVTSSTTLSLTSLTGGLDTAPATGDLVVLFLAMGSGDIGITTSGYTQVFYQNTLPVSFLVAYKVMGATPDTEVVYTHSRTDVPRQSFAIVLRGGVYESVTTANATTGAINPAVSSTFSQTGSIVVFAGMTIASSSTLPTTSDTTIDFLAAASDGKASAQQSGCGLVSASTTFDPAAFTQAVSNDDWYAATVVVLPA